MRDIHVHSVEMSNKQHVSTNHGERAPRRSSRSGRSSSNRPSNIDVSSPLPVRRIRSASSSSILTKTPNSFTPITAHYSLNKTLYQAFYKLCEKKHYRTALSVGIQFCRVALYDIPQHSYYNSPKYEDLKLENIQQALKVSEMLPAILNKVGKELKAKGESSYREKLDEVNVLKEISKDHYHSNASVDITSFHHRKSEVKKEVLVVDDDDFPWAIDCCGQNRMSLASLCPPSGMGYSNQLLPTVSESQDQGINSERKSSRRTSKRRPSQDRPHRRDSKGKGGVEGVGLTDSDLARAEFSRAVSAPAHLGKVLPMRSSNRNLTDDIDWEVREPPPPSLIEVKPPSPSAPPPPQLEYFPSERTQKLDVLPESKSKEETQYDSDLERALYLSGLELQPTWQDEHRVEHRFAHLKKKKSDALTIELLSQLYRADFEELQKHNAVRVSYVDTYQGRKRESINGCTVIAPLLAIHHLRSSDGGAHNVVLQEKMDCNSLRVDVSTDGSSEEGSKVYKGIDDGIVKLVIDEQAPLILPRVRKKLGLHKDALIIPSDVHDYFIEERYLAQDQFAGVFGGNILDDRHLTQFIDHISKLGRQGAVETDADDSSENKKVAATFFFHEHVVSLHRVTRQLTTSFREEACKPQKKKFFSKLRFRKNKNSLLGMETITEEETWYEIIDSLPGAAMFNDETREQNPECYSIPSTARIRCLSPHSLHATLKWYACSKFSNEDKKYINSYVWDDMNVEFDPRVFQAFVWKN